MVTYLITGAAGTLGSILCRKIIERGDKCRAFDINEAGLSRLVYPPERFTRIWGDCSRWSDINKAMRGVDIVIHCAAMKNVDITESNAPACILNNVVGTQYVAEAAMERKVKTAIFISSDKAVEPTTLYGATKLTGEHLWKAAGRIQKETLFTIVRSGNFFESNGNVFEVWARQKKEEKPITLTDVDMKRYFIDAEDVADIALEIPPKDLMLSDPTEYYYNCSVVVPHMKEYSMLELMILKYGDEQEYIVTGKRQGEKMQEKLRTEDEKDMLITNNYTVVR